MFLALLLIATSLHTIARGGEGAAAPLRAKSTMAEGVKGKQPLIFFVGWLSCDSILGDSETDGFSKFILRTIKTSGFATFRVDKPEPCAALDFNGELAAYREAFRYASKLPNVDPNKIVIVGLSNGGGIAPLVAEGHPIAAYVSIGGWGRTWLEHMLEHERERLRSSGKPPAEVNEQLKLFAEFYDRYLIRGEKPGDIVNSDARFKKIWYDAPDGQYGRPAAFYQQLQSLNLEREWSSVRAPVLVIRGGADIIMSHHDAAAIANAAHGKLVTRPGMDHFLDVNGKFDDALAGIVREWLRRQR